MLKASFLSSSLSLAFLLLKASFLSSGQLLLFLLLLAGFLRLEKRDRSVTFLLLLAVSLCRKPLAFFLLQTGFLSRLLTLFVEPLAFKLGGRELPL